MRRFLTFSALLIAPILNTYSQESGVFAFQGVNVLPMDGRDVTRDQTVIVRDSRIETIGAAAETDIPQGARRIDGSGRYLVPGLTEMHAHLPGAAERQYLEEVLFLFVANGITTIRVMQPGDPFFLELRDDLIPDREVLGPRIYTGGPTLLGRRVESPEAARRMVFEQAEAGYDFIKMHAGLTPDQYDAAVEAAKEVGIAFAGHVAPAVGIERALAAGQASLEHLDSYVEYMLFDDVDLSETPAGFYGINVVDYVDCAGRQSNPGSGGLGLSHVDLDSEHGRSQGGTAGSPAHGLCAGERLQWMGPGKGPLRDNPGALYTRERTPARGDPGAFGQGDAG